MTFALEEPLDIVTYATHHTLHHLLHQHLVLGTCLFVCFSGRHRRRKSGIPFFRDLASRPRGVEKGASLPPVLMVGMNKHS